jgi:hypothetical protein
VEVLAQLIGVTCCIRFNADRKEFEIAVAVQNTTHLRRLRCGWAFLRIASMVCARGENRSWHQTVH